MVSGSLAQISGQIGEPPKIDVPPKDETEDVIKIETRLIEVPIVVTDRNKKPVLNLKPTNFVVYEDGREQEITEFAATSAPFEIAILLDTSGSTRNDLRLIRRAAERFINSLRQGDRVAIVAFTTKREDGQSFAATQVVQYLTDDRKELEAVLSTVHISNGTPFYDGLLKIAEDIFRQPPAEQFRGRRAIVALTDGVDSSSISEFEEVRRSLLETGLPVYFIRVDTRAYLEEMLLGDCMTSKRFSFAQLRRYYRQFPRNAQIEKVTDFCQLGDFERLDISRYLYELAETQMRDLAVQSGGRVFPAADLSEARSAFSEVAAELGTRYSLGYYSSNQARDGTYRRIRVELKGVPAGTEVRARDGYLAPNR